MVRERDGWMVRERDGWLVGTTSRLYALYGAALLPLALVFATVEFATHDPAESFFHFVGWTGLVAGVLMVGFTNEVRVDPATGAVRTRRGLFGIARRHEFVRPQIDGVFVTIREDARQPGRFYCAVGLQAGLGRWAMLRTMDSERAIDFYRDLKEVTGFLGIEGY